MDAYFLHKERCFRKLYDWIITNRMNSEDYQYNLDYRRFENKVDPILRIMLSRTIIPIYGTVIVILIGLSIHNI